MKRKIIFWLTALPIIWLIVIAPLTTLLSWWTTKNVSVALPWSMLATPAVAAWIFTSFQTASIARKWPATQFIGATTILLSVVIACSLLRLFLPEKTVALIATCSWIALLAYAVFSAHKVRNTTLTLRSNKIKQPYTLLHLSDIHAGSRSRQFIERVVNQSMDYSPDLVLITGDLLDSSQVDSSYLAPLSRFQCPVYLCLGNHERYVDLQNAIDSIEANKVKILRSENAQFKELEITGIDDTDHPDTVPQALPAIERNHHLFQVLLYHRPTGFEAAANQGIDLMLSGHTHAGQIWPFGLLVKRQFPRMKGTHTLNNSTLHVSQGTGTWGPTMRLGTRSEITKIILQPEN